MKQSSSIWNVQIVTQWYHVFLSINHDLKYLHRTLGIYDMLNI